jgi:Trm5-related predicted tRNA methylase
METNEWLKSLTFRAKNSPIEKLSQTEIQGTIKLLNERIKANTSMLNLVKVTAVDYDFGKVTVTAYSEPAFNFVKDILKKEIKPSVSAVLDCDEGSSKRIKVTLRILDVGEIEAESFLMDLKTFNPKVDFGKWSVITSIKAGVGYVRVFLFADENSVNYIKNNMESKVNCGISGSTNLVVCTTAEGKQVKRKIGFNL